MDRQEIESRINKLETELSFKRATGRTSRIVNHTIEEFFQKPKGTAIEIGDHYIGFNMGVDKKQGKVVFDISHGRTGNVQYRTAARMVARKIKDRLDHEYPNVAYELDINHYPLTITRKSETNEERLRKEIVELKLMLEDI